MIQMIMSATGRPLGPAGYSQFDRIVNTSNAKGDEVPLTLDFRGQTQADYWYGHIKNALGFDIPITTMTTVARKATTQNFFEIAPADYLPVIAGQGAWGDQLLTLREFIQGDTFETGITNLSQTNARIPAIDAALDSIVLPIYTWNKAAYWSLPQIEQAAKAGNWDYAEALQKSRKKNWDLGIQHIAFLGAAGMRNTYNNCYGLLTLPNVYTDSSIFSAAGNVPISEMPQSNLNTFVKSAISLYRANAQKSAWPDCFYMPEDDWIGIGGTQYSPTFPIGSIGEILEKMFRQSIPTGKWRGIKPISYAQASFSSGVLTTNTYMLMRYDDETINMQIPVPYTTTVPNSINNYQLQDVGYGQFTGVQALRPREIMYLAGGFTS